MLRLTLFGRFRAVDESGKEIPIKSRKARALLAYLALPPGKTRSREGVLTLLWSDRGEEQARASLRQALSGLRKELGQGALEALRIDEDSLSLDPDLVVVEPAAGGDKLLDGLQVNDPAFEEWLRDERLRLEGSAADTGPAGTANSTGKPSILVLPFNNLSADPEQQYFSDGITEDVATELCRFGSLDVLARQSAFVLRDRAEDISKTLADLGADYYLEGSLRKAGTRIRLTAQLVDVESGKQLWAERYDRDLDDIFAIQDDLVHAIVAKLAGRLETEGRERALRKPPENLAAYDCYLQGLWYDRRYDTQSALAGRRILEKAVALDPGFARAHGMLAVFMMYDSWFVKCYGHASQEVVDVARKAVELDPNDADCYAKLGIIHIDRGEHEEAQRNLETALRLNPHDSYIWAHYAWYLMTMGEPEQALAYLDRTLAVDPHPPNWHWDIRAEALYGLERYQEAIEILERKASPHYYNFGQLAACHGQLGQKKEAAACWAKLLTDSPDTKLADVGKDLAYLNKVDEERWTDGLLKAGLSD
jgi:TolB-like protein/Flp pilus assembly protein TadD